MLPGYDQGPVVHHRYGDDEEPVVVGVSSWINHCDLLKSGHMNRRIIGPGGCKSRL